MRKHLSRLFVGIIILTIGMSNCVFAADAAMSGKPSAPSVTSYTAVSSSSIKIGWKSVPGATKYRVDRRRTDESDYRTLTSNCTSTSYTDSGLKSGSTYYYRVYAINSAGTSARSITYEAHTKPSTPTISSVNRDSDTQLTVKWNSVSGATKYKITYRRGDINDYQTLVTNVTGTSYTHKNLTPNAKYWYRVYAIREANIGPEGSRTKKNIESENSERLGNFTKMARPANSTDINNTSHVILSWAKAYGNNNYSYDIYRKSPTDSGFIKLGRTAGLKYIDENATPGIIYKYKINTVVTGEGNSCTWCDEFYAAPRMTKGVVLAPQDANTMKISWDRPSGGSNLKYVVRKWNGSSYDSLPVTSNTYYIDTGLKTGETYRYYVDVRDEAGIYLTNTIAMSAVLQILPSSITLNKTTLNIGVGETSTLSFTISPGNSTNKSVTWKSEDDSIASVSSNGIVTAKKLGTTTVTAQTSNGKTASCTINITTCAHTYGDWVTEKNPTCEQNGIRSRICSKCKGIDYAEIKATGHSYSADLKTIKEPTCTENGEKARVCTICSAQTDNTVIEKREHSYHAWRTEKNASCSEEGLEYRICSECNTRDERTIDKTEHSYGEWNGKAATCTEPGDEYRICTSCGLRETRQNEALGHRYEYFCNKTVGETETAIEIYLCKICNASYEKIPDAEKVYEGDIFINNYAAAKGREIAVSVNIQNNPGINTFRFHLQYDTEVLVPVMSADGRCVNRGTLLENQGKPIGTLQSNLNQDTNAADPIIAWDNSGSQKNITGSGELFTVRFKIQENAPLGVYPISLTYDERDIHNSAGAYVQPDVAEGSIMVTDNAVIRGDIDMNGLLNGEDCGLLARYIVIQNPEKKEKFFSAEQKKAANVYADSNIDHKDGVRVSQLVGGYA